MKKFLINIVLFVISGSLLLATLVSIYTLRVWQFSYPINNKIHHLFVGDSRFRNAVIEEIIPNSLNISADADNYMTAYLRIKFLLRNQNAVKTIFLVFSPDICGENADSRLFEDYLMAGKIPTYFPFYTEDEWTCWVLYSPLKLVNNIAGKPIKLLKGVFSAENQFCKHLGSPNPTSRKGLKESLQKRSHYSEQKKYGDTYSLIYLQKIKDICKEKGIRLVGVSMPYYDARTYFDISAHEKRLKEKFSDWEIWNYLEMEIDDDCWQDRNHLNRWGAEIFSKEIAERMIREGIN